MEISSFEMREIRCPNCGKKLNKIIITLKEIYITVYEKSGEFSIEELEKYCDDYVDAFVDKSIEEWERYSDDFGPDETLVVVDCPHCSYTFGEYDPETDIKEILEEIAEEKEK